MRSYDRDFYGNFTLLSYWGTSSLVNSVDMLVNGSDTPSILFACGALGFTFFSAVGTAEKYRIWRSFHDIMKTEEFKEYKELYHEYVTDISDFLNSLGVKGDLSGAYLYKLLLDDGVFSENREVSVGSYKKDQFDRFIDVMGGRVATGAYCCRHAASLLTDVINGMGGVAANVSVINKSFGRKDKIGMRPDHLVTAFIHDDKCAMVDPLLDQSFFPIGATPIIDEKRKTVNHIKARSLNSTIFLEGRESDYSIEGNNKKNFKKIMKKPSLQLDSEISDIYDLTKNKFKKYNHEIEEFHNDELPKIKKLSKLNKIITPYSDPE